MFNLATIIKSINFFLIFNSYVSILISSVEIY